MKKTSFKLKVAILFGYNGSGFHGLLKVKDPLIPTVEGALEKALFEVGLITDQNYGNLQKSGWGRGSRTDKGVHASVNVVKCKMVVDEKFTFQNNKVSEDDSNLDKKAFKKIINYEHIIKEINSTVDPRIQTFAIKLVTKNFDVKNSARSRKYEYILPAKLLACKATEGLNKDELLEKLNIMLSKFKGCKSYHNFTKKGDPKSRSNDRFIIDINAEYFKPVYLAEELRDDYIIVYLHGQSFIYHQIRKMIGSVLQTLQLGLTEDFIDNAFKNEPVNIWLAPGQGLLLNRVK
jgi:tRNA pseudouridine38-40 synthase